MTARRREEEGVPGANAEGGANPAVKGGERGFARRLGLSRGTGRGASAEGGVEAVILFL